MKRLAFLIGLMTFSYNVILAQAEQPNIIYIISDDLATYIQGYNSQPQVLTPNLYALQQQGTVFLNAHAPSPKCAPSRTSILVGKDSEYTQVYDNTSYACLDFRKNFKPIYGNGEVFTLPEYLKDSAGYYTYSIGKVFHCYEAYADFDSDNPDPCSRDFSWNDEFTYVQDDIIDPIGNAANEGIFLLKWARLDDSILPYMEDDVSVNKAIEFIQDFDTFGTDITCGKPFFLGLGIKQPHAPLYVPESFFPDWYLGDIYAEPFNKPYNEPYNAYPPNGLVMPPQPNPVWSDYDSLSYMGQLFASTNEHDQFMSYGYDLVPLPEIDPILTDSERIAILQESQRANAISAYIAGIQFADYEIGRFLDELALHPEVYNNTIIILTADHGFSMGTKKHWGKFSLWETDLRVPLMYIDLRNPVHNVSNKAVSTMDIFPTILDLLDVEEPTFLDGSRYLDGYSFLPLTQNPTLPWEKASLAIIRTKNSAGTLNDGSCFSQYSVKNNRFHYIQYHSNNAPPLLTCDELASQTEEELYDIGENRETDPNEWNNLIGNPDYELILNYMKAFVPGGSLYNKQPYSASIYTTLPPACLIKNTAKIKLKSDLYNELGTLLAPAATTEYTFTWTNSLTAATFTGKNYTFNMASIPAATFAAASEIIFYLEVTENATGNLVAFNTKTYYINTATKPVINFNLECDAINLTATIIGHTLSGTYTSNSWDFDDGTVLKEYEPNTHTYATPGIYPVVNTVGYGNGCFISKTRSADVLLRVGELNVNCNIYPNPSTGEINIVVDHALLNTNIQIINVLGQTVFEDVISNGTYNVELKMNHLPQGNYWVRLNNGDWNTNEMFVIQR